MAGTAVANCLAVPSDRGVRPGGGTESVAVDVRTLLKAFALQGRRRGYAPTMLLDCHHPAGYAPLRRVGAAGAYAAVDCVHEQDRFTGAGGVLPRFTTGLTVLLERGRTLHQVVGQVSGLFLAHRLRRQDALAPGGHVVL